MKLTITAFLILAAVVVAFLQIAVGAAATAMRVEPASSQSNWHCVYDVNNECAQFHRLSSLSMVSANEGWAVGYQGVIMHYKGGVWQAVESPTKQHLNSVSMVSTTDGWAVGDAGTVLHYDGSSWQARTAYDASSPVTDNLRSVSMVSADAGWAVGDNDTFLSYDYWGRWVKYAKAYANRSHSDLTFVTTTSSSPDRPGDGGWALGPSGYRLYYSGGDWHPDWEYPTPCYAPFGSSCWLLRSMAMVSATEGWAVGEAGVIWQRTAGGWRAYDSPIHSSLNSVAMVSPTEGWAVGDFGAIVRFKDGNWQRVSSPTSGQLNSVVMVSPNEGWAVGYGARIFHYTSMPYSRTLTGIGK